MNSKQLKIKGYKSIGEIVLKSPNPFSVFVGANGAGKSNIFEALEFMNYCNVMDTDEAIKYFGEFEDVMNKNLLSIYPIVFDIKLNEIKPYFSLRAGTKLQPLKSSWGDFGKYFSESFSMKDLKDTIAKGEYLHLD